MSEINKRIPTNTDPTALYQYTRADFDADAAAEIAGAKGAWTEFMQPDLGIADEAALEIQLDSMGGVSFYRGEFQQERDERRSVLDGYIQGPPGSSFRWGEEVVSRASVLFEVAQAELDLFNEKAADSDSKNAADKAHEDHRSRDEAA